MPSLRSNSTSSLYFSPRIPLLAARPSRSTRSSVMAVASALHSTGSYANPRPSSGWGPIRSTRCTQYDPRTATIFTRLELFPRTVARPKALRWEIEMRLRPCLRAADGLLPSALCFACAPLPRWLFSSLHPCLVRTRAQKKKFKTRERREHSRKKERLCGR